MMRTLALLATAMSLALASTIACAQGATSRPVRILVPVPPGGPSDTAMRLIAPKLGEALGTTVVVDNRPGSNGVAGTEIASKAAPDGLTLAVGNSGTHAINASLYRKLPYDPVRDFVPITQIVTSGMVLVANPKVSPNSLTDLIALAKKQSGKLNVGIAGATGQLAGDALWSQTQIRLNNVHYKGSSPTEFALLSGEVELAMLTPLATVPHINAGKLKAFGITSAQRSPLLPNLPTIAEQGVQGYDFQIWHGMFAPAKTPDRVVRAVHRGVLRALEAPEVRNRFGQLGFVIIGSKPEEFAKVVRSEVEKFRKVIIESGIPLL